MIFSHYRAGITNTIPDADFTLEKTFDYLRSDKAKTITQRYRNLPPEQKARLKTTLFESVTFAGTCSVREDAAMLSDSGLLCIDIDHLSNQGELSPGELKELIKEDCNLATRLAFVSPSADGLKVVIERPQGFGHIEYYKALENYFNEAYGIAIDEKCINVSRTCFLPYDPEAYYSENPPRLTGEALARWKATYSATPEAIATGGPLRSSGTNSLKDPREKPGIVGAFCRTYTVPEAIATFLPETYTRTRKPQRYTYAPGSSYGGLLVSRDGLTAHSFHGTDPAGGRTCNAFDLVRIHLFGNDDGGPGSTSFKRMAALAEKDTNVTQSIAADAFQDTVQVSQRTISNYAGIGAEGLQTITPIDLRKEAEKLGLKPSKKDLSQFAVEVVIIDSLNKILDEKGMGLAYHNDKPYIYNGQYWRFLDKTQINLFLVNAAMALGCPPIIARQWKNQESLLKQFRADCLLDLPEKDLNNVKINFKNGTLDINRETTVLRDFDKKDFLTYQLPYEYDPEAKAPMFEKYLNRVLPDKQAQTVIAEYLGNALGAPALQQQKILFLIGNGNNGKSVFCDIVKATMGKENVSAFSLSSLTQENSHSRPLIEDKLLNYCSDISTDLNINNFKIMARGEEIEARYLFNQSFVMTHYARLVFNCNSFPTNLENSEGFWRSFLTIPFEQTISPEERDPELAKKIIAAELPGIMNWILEGARRVIHNKKYSPCPLADQTLEKYRIAASSTLSFLQDKGYKPGFNESCLISELYNAFKFYCQDSTRAAVGNKKFHENLEKAGYTVKRERSGFRVYYSKLVEDGTQDTNNNTEKIDDIF